MWYATSLEWDESCNVEVTLRWAGPGMPEVEKFYNGALVELKPVPTSGVQFTKGTCPHNWRDRPKGGEWCALCGATR